MADQSAVDLVVVAVSFLICFLKIPRNAGYLVGFIATYWPSAAGV